MDGDAVDGAEERQVELFVDDRGAVLRVTWHVEDAQVVVSHWRDGRCVASHRLTPADATRLAELLTHASADPVEPEPDPA